MVALSFKGQFAGPIVAGTKRQTVRMQRKHPPRVGQLLQLYTGMRTKHCRKIVPDVPCTEVSLIMIVVDADHPELIAGITFDGRDMLRDREIERFAVADGFTASEGCSARRAMGNFWMRHHGPGEFIGHVIRWEPK
jgi:hypothetical protein